MKVEEEGFFVIRSTYETYQVDYLVPEVELASTIKRVVSGPFPTYEKARDAMGKALETSSPLMGTDFRKPGAYWVVKVNDSLDVRSVPIGVEPDNAVEGPFMDASSNPGYQQALKAMTALMEVKP